MFSSVATYVNMLVSEKSPMPTVIDWGCPVPFFGDITGASIATVGINPSNREFVDADGRELDGPDRRFPTLRSLHRRTWLDVEATQIAEIVEACMTYFQRSPYDRWFRVLERVLPEGFSLYEAGGGACHLDLVPYATKAKWGTLGLAAQRALLDATRDALGRLLADSTIELLVLNGQSVVREFERLTEVELARTPVPSWRLPRGDGQDVRGWAYTGRIDSLLDVDLGRSIAVVGYNHNLQSSYGVTSTVVASIGDWLAEATDEVGARRYPCAQATEPRPTASRDS